MHTNEKIKEAIDQTLIILIAEARANATIETLDTLLDALRSVSGDATDDSADASVD